MFEEWPVEFTPEPRRIVDPPLPVAVDVAAAIGQPGDRPANELPLRVRAEGLSLDVRGRHVREHLIIDAPPLAAHLFHRQPVIFCCPGEYVLR
ncbi:hypothetical protein [Nocardia sp. NPDC004604]|uniref:hypothetical protein n=1 Tax=Nocardia sp. NPDC004604 TaxID=3157013 RepID=UPI0033A77BEC